MINLILTVLQNLFTSASADDEEYFPKSIFHGLKEKNGQFNREKKLGIDQVNLSCLEYRRSGPELQAENWFYKFCPVLSDSALNQSDWDHFGKRWKSLQILFKESSTRKRLMDSKVSPPDSQPVSHRLTESLGNLANCLLAKFLGFVEFTTGPDAVSNQCVATTSGKRMPVYPLHIQILRQFRFK